MKNIFATLSLLLLLPLTVRAQFAFTTNSGAITITGYDAAAGLNVVIPASTNGYPVTMISVNGFSNQTTITSVTIPSSVSNIGKYAFTHCSSLTNATFQGNAPLANGIPGSANNSVFSGETGTAYYLTGTSSWGSTFGGWNTAPLQVPPFGYTANNGAITITNYTGSGGAVVVPASIIGVPVTMINKSVFYYKGAITSVIIPDSVTNISPYAFWNCSGLTNVIIGGGITNIGLDAFYDCSGLRNLIIPDSVTSIGLAAFWNCSGLTNVTIGNSVNSIGTNAFFDCTNLTSVTIPASVTNIVDGSAFFECFGLTNISVSAANPDYASVGGVLYDKRIATLLEGPGGLAGSYTIPNSVTNINEAAFFGCTSLKSVTIPGHVASLGAGAFGNCSGLTNASFQGNAPLVDSETGSQDNSVFSGDPGTAYYLAGTSGWGSTFGGWNTAQVQVPPFGYTANNGAITITNYTGPGGAVVIPASVIGVPVTVIAANAFYNKTAITSVVIPNSVTNIGNSAFALCSSLTNAYFQGNAPLVNGAAGTGNNTVFSGETGTVNYPAGTSGWGATFGGWPTFGPYQPQPQILGAGQGLGGQNTPFGFTTFWATNTSVIVLASTDLLTWTPIITNVLVGGTNVFTDFTWTNYPQRFYQVQAQ